MFDTFQEMAVSVADAVEPYLDVPYAMFGHCSSALVAYEVTAELERRGLSRPSALFVSSQVAPQDGPVGSWLTMRRAEIAEELAELVAASGSAPQPEVIELNLEILEGDIAAHRRYVMPDPQRLETPIMTIGWREDAEVDYRNMGGWSDCGHTRTAVIEGDHRRFIEAPDELLELLVEGMPAPEGHE